MTHLSTGGRTGNAGSSKEYCSYDTFVNPVDIRPITFALSGFNVTPTNVPITRLDVDEVKEGVTEMAAVFFKKVLKLGGNQTYHFSGHLDPKWLEKHVAMVDRAEAFSSADALCPPGQNGQHEECEF
jgi:hypothetical protein